MGIQHLTTPIHWNYFLAIEEDLYTLSRYVDFSSDNDTTYSLEIAKILMSASAEVDVVLKQLCITKDPNSTAGSINSYHDIIETHINSFKSFKVTIPIRGLELTPWISWRNGSPPIWWTANNKLKH